jgi:hypothetical protein
MGQKLTATARCVAWGTADVAFARLRTHGVIETPEVFIDARRDRRSTTQSAERRRGEIENMLTQEQADPKTMDRPVEAKDFHPIFLSVSGAKCQASHERLDWHNTG